jgi:hypothetical protein
MTQRPFLVPKPPSSGDCGPGTVVAAGGKGWILPAVLGITGAGAAAYFVVAQMNDLNSMGEVRPKERVPLAKGEKIAEVVRAHIEPFTQAMILVGSIRRKRPEIADVEFVIIPKEIEMFDQAAVRLGFSRGAKLRKYTGRSGGLKIEFYIAHEPEELGALMLAYTGDWLFNVAMRSQAKRMGYKLDQYGIWKGRKSVLQSVDEKEFFDFLGMDWHAPEERSLAQRGALRKAVKALLARRLSEDSRTAVERAAKILRGRDPSFRSRRRDPGSLQGSRLSMGAMEMGYQPFGRGSPGRPPDRPGTA